MDLAEKKWIGLAVGMGLGEAGKVVGEESTYIKMLKYIEKLEIRRNT